MYRKTRCDQWNHNLPKELIGCLAPFLYETNITCLLQVNKYWKNIIYTHPYIWSSFRLDDTYIYNGKGKYTNSPITATYNLISRLSIDVDFIEENNGSLCDLKLPNLKHVDIWIRYLNYKHINKLKLFFQFYPTISTIKLGIRCNCPNIELNSLLPLTTPFKLVELDIDNNDISISDIYPYIKHTIILKLDCCLNDQFIQDLRCLQTYQHSMEYIELNLRYIWHNCSNIGKLKENIEYTNIPIHLTINHSSDIKDLHPLVANIPRNIVFLNINLYHISLDYFNKIGYSDTLTRFEMNISYSSFQTANLFLDIHKKFPNLTRLTIYYSLSIDAVFKQKQANILFNSVYEYCTNINYKIKQIKINYFKIDKFYKKYKDLNKKRILDNIFSF